MRVRRVRHTGTPAGPTARERRRCARSPPTGAGGSRSPSTAASISRCCDTSRTAAITSPPSPVPSGPRLTSTGNVEPSRRRASSERPAPNLRTCGRAYTALGVAHGDLVSPQGEACRRSRPASSSREYPNNVIDWAFDRRDPPVGIDANHRIRRGFQQLWRSGLRRAPRHLPAGRSTPRRSTSPSSSRTGDIDITTSIGLPISAEASAPIAALGCTLGHSPMARPLLVEGGRREREFDVLADDVVRGVAVNLCRAVIPRGHGAVDRLGDHRVGRRPKNRSEGRRLGSALPTLDASASHSEVRLMMASRAPRLPAHKCNRLG